MQRRNFRSRSVITKDEDPSEIRRRCCMIGRWNSVFTAITSTNEESAKRRRVKKLANSRNHHRIVTGNAGWLNIVL